MSVYTQLKQGEFYCAVGTAPELLKWFILNRDIFQYSASKILSVWEILENFPDKGVEIGLDFELNVLQV